MKDVSRRLIEDRIKDLRENTDFVSALFESLVGYAIIAADFDGNVIAYNEGARQIYGYAPEEIIGKQNIEIFFPKDFIKAGGLQHIIGDLIGKERLSYEGEKLRKKDETFPAQILLTLTKDKKGKVVGFIEIVQDLTERKRVGEELRKHREHLEELIEERTAELKKINAQLKNEITERKRAEEVRIQTEKMTALGTMTAGIAHELNNPMTGILHFAQYCLKYTSEDDKRYTVLQDVVRETNRCADIVQNLLTFSHTGKEGEEAYEKGSCAVVLGRVSKLFSYRIEKQGVLVTQHIAEGTPDIWMGVNNIQQVFFNLINNALDSLKDSKKKEIHIDIHHEGEFVQVTITDTGCGIAPESLGKILDPFFTTKPVGQGTGLGLSVSHSIIKAHGGGITYESEPGVGTKFKVLLPIERRKTKEETKMSKCILVIDDDEAIRKSFTLTFEDTGYEVHTAESGEKGIGMEQNTKYDLVFLDLKMPGINGVEALRELRKIDKDVPIYIVTAFHQEFFDQLEGAQQEGLDFQVLRKPIAPEELVLVTKGILEGPIVH